MSSVDSATSFRAAVESRDIDAAQGLFAEDIVFHSPATFEKVAQADRSEIGQQTTRA